MLLARRGPLGQDPAELFAPHVVVWHAFVSLGPVGECTP